MMGNISFTRPLEVETGNAMVLDHEKKYFAYLNWGIFDDEYDIDTKYLYGAKDQNDY
jgi:hypothetical protein